MCTVSVVRAPRPAAGSTVAPSWRVVCNRDERRTRAMALPPALGSIGRFTTVSPIDPDGPGTWIAATSAGLVFALLNGRAGAAADRFTSRGRIIPLVAGACDLDDAAARLRRLRPQSTQPFSLLLASDAGVLPIEWDGRALFSHAVIAEPLVMRTSSSCDADAVLAARTEAFRRHVRDSDADAQDAFHTSGDRGRPGCGVLMSRGDACTVSITTIEMFGSHLTLAYQPVSEGRLDMAPATRLEVRRVR
jgi:hypothetical protein